MHITRTEAIKLFEAFGCKMADKWNKKQMNKKIINIDEMLNDYTKGNPETDKTLDSIMTAIENNDEIIVDNDLSEKEKTYSVYIHPESDSIFVDLDGKAEDGLSYAEVEGLSKREAEEKSKEIQEEYFAKEGKKEIEETEELDPPKKLKIKKPKKVRILKSRSYYAGVIIRNHGISAGISEAMVNELDKLFKKKNREESDYRLRLAWHSIAGFCGIETN